MIVQIYEIQTPDEAERCIELGVDHLGSVLLSQDEWRREILKEVTRLTERADIKTSLIPLFQDTDTLYRVIDYYRPDYIHFCESLTDPDGREVELGEFVELQSGLKEKFPEIGIIRSLPIPEDGSSSVFSVLSLARTLASVSDVFLTDTWLGKEPVTGYIGITGITCDREAARELVLQSEIPVILAGGLSPENVYEAVLNVLPAGADSCTQTNRVDREGKPIRFQKDFEKVKKFVTEVRKADAQVRRKMKVVEKKVDDLKDELHEREAALPAHSVKPQQLLAIEGLEDEIAKGEKELGQMKRVFGGWRLDTSGGKLQT